MGKWDELNSISDLSWPPVKTGSLLFFYEKNKGFVFSDTSKISPEQKKSFSLVFQLNKLAQEEIDLLQDARNGKWDKIDLFDATLIAEGKVSLKSRAPYREKYDQFVRELKERTDLLSSEKLKTRIVYEFMHRKILTGNYDLNLSSLAASFDRGVFNCVSATILFGALAHEVGLSVAGLETTGHAKSRVFFDQEYLDIETTCTKWSQLPDRLIKQNSGNRNSFYSYNNQYNHESDNNAAPYLSSEEISTTVARPIQPLSDPSTGSINSAAANDHADGNSTGSSLPAPKIEEESDSSFVPPQMVWSGTRKMRQINEVQLIATIYYNRGVDHYQEERYNEALADYAKALQLDPDNKTIFGNFKATLNNWAIQLALQKNFPESIRLTEAGLILDPDFEQFKINLPIFYQHWVAELEKEGRSDEADYLRKKYIERFPDE
ncbi:MAG: tetratricopeptide repeat protein [Planctomycetia bacterium]|nr:tetratricopeptide repeat protein [Planctomycetia bacterium]